MSTVERKVERECARCGTAFFVTRYEVGRGHGTYCSRACTSIAAKRTQALTREEALAEREHVETLRWPDERHLIPQRCPRPHCGGMVETDPPYGLVKVGEARCLSCTRIVCELKAGAVREIRGRVG